MDAERELYEELRPRRLRDRLPDARQRRHGRGRRPGGAAAPARGDRGRRGDRLAARLPRDRRHPPGDRRAAVSAGCGARPTSASGCPSRWSPPMRTTRHADAEIADSLSLAFLVLLESLTPEQRAVFLLREVFDYPYDRIAEIVGKREAATRQLAVRRPPRGRASAGRASRPSPSGSERLAERFFAASAEGDLAALEALLAADVELHGDGGGKVPALARAVTGRARVARTLSAWWKAGERFGGITFRRVEVNGQPGAIVLASDDKVISVLVLEVAGGQISGVRLDREPRQARPHRAGRRYARPAGPQPRALLSPRSAARRCLEAGQRLVDELVSRTFSSTGPRAIIESIRPGSRPVSSSRLGQPGRRARRTRTWSTSRSGRRTRGGTRPSPAPGS